MTRTTVILEVEFYEIHNDFFHQFIYHSINPNLHEVLEHGGILDLRNKEPKGLVKFWEIVEYRRLPYRR